MNKKDVRYWIDNLDRFGLMISGIFIGGMIEAIGIPQLSIVISIGLLIPICLIIHLLKQKIMSKQTEMKKKVVVKDE